MDMAKDISLQRKLQILTNCLDLLSRARIIEVSHNIHKLYINGI